MSQHPLLSNESWLRQQYEVEHRTIIEIANQVGCTPPTLMLAFARFGISSRTAAESMALRGTKPGSSFPKLNDHSWLRQQYEAEHRSVSSIAKEVGCTTSNVSLVLKKIGVTIRYRQNPKAGPATGKEKLHDAAYLHQRYVVDKLSMEQLGKEIGCNASAVMKALRRNNIPTRASHGGRGKALVLIAQLNDPDWLDHQFCVQQRHIGSIAKELSCSRGHVISALRRFGISRKQPRPDGPKKAKSADIFPLLADVEWLRNEYLVKERSSQSLATEIGCTVWAVQAALCRWRILKFAPRLRGTKDPSLPSGTFRVGKGYIGVTAPDHPFANGRGIVLQHRLVCEEALGRYLTPEEEVHHLNEVIQDNRLENLLVMPSFKEHIAFHNNPPDWIPRCPCCKRPQPELLIKRPDNIPLVWIPLEETPPPG